MSLTQHTKKIPTQENLNEITTFFFKLQLLNKVYHWNTTSYARHMATDRFNGSMPPIVDKFIEVFIGRYQLKPIVSQINLRPENLTDEGIKQYFIRAKEYVQQLENYLSDTELLNIRDELLAEINQTLYLFELK
jgi:hypothetical protein